MLLGSATKLLQQASCVQRTNSSWEAGACPWFTSVKSWWIHTDNVFGHRWATTKKLKFHQHRLQISLVLLLSARNLLGPTAVVHKGPPTNLLPRSLTTVMAKVSKTGKHKSWGELKTEPQILYPSPVLLTSHTWLLQAENALPLRVPSLLYNP